MGEKLRIDPWNAWNEDRSDNFAQPNPEQIALYAELETLSVTINGIPLTIRLSKLLAQGEIKGLFYLWINWNGGSFVGKPLIPFQR